MTPEQFKAIAERAGLTFFVTNDLDAGVADDADVYTRLAIALAEPVPANEMLTVQDGSALARSMFQLEPEPQDVRGLVLDMRDAFLTMVTGFNTVGAYKVAQDAQTMAVALHTFERQHSITGLAWPLEVVREEGNSPGLRTIYESDNVRYGEDL